MHVSSAQQDQFLDYQPMNDLVVFALYLCILCNLPFAVRFEISVASIFDSRKVCVIRQHLSFRKQVAWKLERR